ncbi:hypothetical protein [Riemerella columbina]|uniref:hypothetical protein n=1 Tax=Riemerella columbina TaxID=103810 RepID=UPI0003648936|nr:hypothetical protein [Riemerella columbina]
MIESFFNNRQEVIDVCIPLIIAIFGLAYPIILNKISNMGDKYQSNYIPLLFSTECLQKKIKWIRINIIELIIYCSLGSLFFIVFSFPPLFGKDCWFVINSANILTIVLTILLVIFIIRWLNLIIIYNEDIKKLFNHIKKRYSESNSTEIKQYSLKAINELALYSVNKQDSRLEIDISKFYIELVVNFKNEYLRKKTDNNNEGVIYPFDLYTITTDLTKEFTKTEDNKLQIIGDYVFTGKLLLSNDFQRAKISEQTYSRLWYNITLIRNNPNFIGRFWANSHQYFRFELEQIYPISHRNENNELTITNEEEIEQRDLERKRFLEFHYALGGLLLYSQNYSGLKYLFTYSQSSPPNYVLLPYTMTDIFEWFEYFRNENNHLGNFIGLNKYRFPDLDNLGNRGQVTLWICKYICILFIRQYSLPQTLNYRNTTRQPNLPDKIYDLYEWKKSLKYFGHCLKSVLKDNRLLEALDLKEIYEKNEKDIKSFLSTLENSIDTQIGTLKLSTPLSKDKIRKFYASSSNIITNGFNQYSDIMNKENSEENDEDLKLSFSGSIILSRKSAFIDNDIPHINYDRAFADSIVRGTIQRYIPNSFITSRTHRYLLNKDNILEGINKIIGDTVQVCIVAFNLFSYKVKDALNKSKYKDKIIHLPSTDFTNTIFILRKQDLPKIEPLEISEAEKKLLKLDQPLVKEWNVYGKVIDINLPENKNIKEQYVDSSIEDEENLQVLLALLFRTKIVFKADRNIIQININSEFEEQGSENSLSDLKPL